MRKSLGIAARVVAGTIAVSLILQFFLAQGALANRATDPLRYLPVQHQGRVKPFDSLAREALQLIYGAEVYESPNGERRDAVEIVFTWMLLPQYWDGQKIIQVKNRGLKESLQLDMGTKYFSFTELFQNSRLSLTMQDLRSFTATKQKLTPYYSAAQRLDSQLGLYQALKQGKVVRVVPPTPEDAKKSEPQPGMPLREPQSWIALSDLHGDLQQKFGAVIHAMVRALPPAAGADAKPIEAASGPDLGTALTDFKTAARAQNAQLYPSDRDIGIEVHYHSFHPFMVAALFYLFATIVLAIGWKLANQKLYFAGWAAAVIAFLLHTYGFALRIYLTGRPPVSNMYETVIWVSWGAFAFSMIFELLYRKRFSLFAGCAVSVFCLLIGDAAPEILDRSLQPLEPVLRSNLWLIIHVMTITLGYAAFSLSWLFGNIALGFCLAGFKRGDDRLRILVNMIYRSMQVGVVLLAAGTILGGVWADYSWGRFWGWDPKETWAFIALMGYLAVLHGRLVGWVQDFGMMVTAVVAFSLVVMAWYGVNFVLGAGLHTYGMGAGGVQYVAGIILLNALYVGYAAYVHSARARQNA